MRKYALKRCFIFPPHLTGASALPGETANPEMVIFGDFFASCIFSEPRAARFRPAS